MKENNSIHLSELGKIQEQARKNEKFKKIRAEVQEILDKNDVTLMASLDVTKVGIFPTFGLIEKSELPPEHPEHREKVKKDN